MSDEWDDTQASSEGWYISTIDGQIKMGFDIAGSSSASPEFLDQWALALVQQRAREGSAYHIEALARTQLL